MRINPSDIPTPRPMSRDLAEDGDEVAEDVLGGVVAIDVFVIGGVGEDVVGEINVIVDVRCWPCRTITIPTGIEKELPDSQQLVPFGPQQYVIPSVSAISPLGHGNKLFPKSNAELSQES